MNKEKKIWLCEQYAHKAWTLSLSFAQEAGRLGHFGRGYAVVAGETRTLANKLIAYTGNAKFDDTESDEIKGIVDFSVHIGLLSINTMLELLRINPVVTDMSVNRSTAVLAEDLLNLARDIDALADSRVWNKPSVLTEIASPLKSTNVTDFFFVFSIGGIPLLENTANIAEVHLGKPADGGKFNLRSLELPVINCYERFGLSHAGRSKDCQTYLIIQPDGSDIINFSSKDMYAVPIDDLNLRTIFQSRIGYAVPPKSSHAFTEYSRECWDFIEDTQLIFVDWAKLI